MKQDHDNARRARSAKRGLPKGDSLDTRIIDALANLRHLCDRHDLDFANLDRIACGHYSTERSHNPKALPFNGSHAPDCPYRHGGECLCWRSAPEQNPELS